MGRRFLFVRLSVLVALLAFQLPVMAACGAVSYWEGSQALTQMWAFIQAFLNITIELLNVIAVLIGFYSSAVIYIKLESGEGEFVKSVSMLCGSIAYFFIMLIVFPSLFSGVYGSGHGGFFGSIF